LLARTGGDVLMCGRRAVVVADVTPQLVARGRARRRTALLLRRYREFGARSGLSGLLISVQEAEAGGRTGLLSVKRRERGNTRRGTAAGRDDCCGVALGDGAWSHVLLLLVVLLVLL